MKTPSEEIRDLANYLEGYSSAQKIQGYQDGARKMEGAAIWLHRLSRRICGAGIIGCDGGETCTSSHK